MNMLQKSKNFGYFTAIFIFLLLLTVRSYPQFGQISKVGTTGAQFLKIGVGSRAVGMGGAFVALANDASAVYWNSAGLSQLRMREVIAVHVDGFMDSYYNFMGFAIPLGGYGTVGISVISVGMGEMEVRTVLEPEGTGEKFDAGSFALGLSFSRSLTDRFSIGFHGKYISERIWHMTASSLALDIGTLYITQFHDFRIGMSISNFGSKMQLKGIDTMVFHDIDETKEGNNDRINAHLDTGSFDLPLLFRVGIAFDILSGGINRLV
ncbi:MAG: PorV/PorQ family protein, partial [Fidelibacterota bacterium]